ncbi:exosortase-associated protein EpsI, B-type [Pseudoduganella sp. GCM10020061]|uniref:exosortase-associated protein EpsI, B-type n=1 Tax=Pseudoduganella sp. GCM10020061 TaxID=3317345 RepID=UPI003641CB1E
MMKRSMIGALMLGGAMVLSAAMAKVATPTVRVSDSRPPVHLAQVFPTKFGDWKEDTDLVQAVVNPATQAELDKIYAQTLSRTYVNSKGERIMLSVAYGTDQSDNLSVHFPEGCYGGQGFAVGPTRHLKIDTATGTIPVARLSAALNARHEPITYWVVVGDRVVDNSWDMKKVKLSYALRGLIPDATLVRVSSITPDEESGFALQDDFVRQMLAAMPEQQQRHYAGTTRG